MLQIRGGIVRKRRRTNNTPNLPHLHLDHHFQNTYILLYGFYEFSDLSPFISLESLLILSCYKRASTAAIFSLSKSDGLFSSRAFLMKMVKV